MKLKEAYETLGIPQNSSEEEAKKAYRNLTKQYHPDVSKDPNATEKFKKINEAFSKIKAGASYEDNPPNFSNPFYGFNVNFNGMNMNDFFNNHANKVTYKDNITLKTDISFKESVFGTNVPLKYKRSVKCTTCNGHGNKQIKSDCKNCDGFSKVTKQVRNAMHIMQCNSCKPKFEKCNSCNDGENESETEITVTIPGGITNNNTLRLQSAGHYVGQIFGQDKYTDILLKVNVIEDVRFTLNGNDVVYNLNISLLEALSGCDKDIPTLEGNKGIQVKNNTRNADIITIPNLGVNRVGNQIVSINVSYPENIEGLISYLKENKENNV